MKRIELSTSSLPRKCSTPELQRLVKSRDLPYTSLSGRRGSNPRPTAWKAVALPTELLPHFNTSTPNLTTPPNYSWARMDSNHRTRKRTDLQSVAVGHLATCPFTRGPLPPPLSQRRDSNPRPADYKSAALPTELLWLVTHPSIHSTLIHCFFWEGKGRLKCQIQKF